MHGSSATSTSVKLVLPSDVKLIDLVHAASEKMAEFAGFDADEALNVGLALREAVINAIVHGNKEDPTLKVHVTLVAAGQRLTATVRDEGEGFDPGAGPDPTAAENLLNTSGRGLLLMRAFVDEIRFRQRRNGGMEITLSKITNHEDQDNGDHDGS
jgi:serine/threonine-protein kinase RsbW